MLGIQGKYVPRPRLFVCLVISTELQISLKEVECALWALLEVSQNHGLKGTLAW